MRGVLALALALALGVGGCGGAAPGTTASDSAAPHETVAGSPSVQEAVTQAVEAGVAGIRSWWPEFASPDVRLIELGSSSGGRFRACGGVDFTTGNAYYCPGDNTLYLDLNYIQGAAESGEVAGAAAAVVTHELGHAWEAQRGYLPDEGATTVKPELFADCISGALIVEMGGDLELAARDAFSVGDYAVDSPDFHGTPGQRRDAVLLGAERGHDACDAYLR